jgi:glycosyltransferase involved in cell wall biosynthesis
LEGRGEGKPPRNLKLPAAPQGRSSAIARWRRPAAGIGPAILDPCGCRARPSSSRPIHSRSQVVVMLGTSSWQLRDGEQVIVCNKSLLGHRHFLVGITRIRNEALILPDTLDYLGKHVDAIIAYDDASTDRTLEILRRHPKVAMIVANRSWEADIEARRIAEGRHRGLLLQMAREHLPFDWMLCFDPDERITGDLRGYLQRTHSGDCDSVRVQLFDAYMTPDDHAPYQADRELLDFRRLYGPERRDILMLWRNRPQVVFGKNHGREPGGLERVATALYCQHYGKSLSTEHWEETCDYYIKHFPFDTYGRKWLERKGRAIHTQSDFMRPLYEWGDALFANAVKI